MLLLLLYIIFDIHLLLYNMNDFTIKDGLYKFNNIKIAIEIYIFLLALIIINAQNNYHFDQKNSTKTEINLILLTNILGISSLIFCNDW